MERYVAIYALLLAASLSMALAAPLKKPTARPGACFNSMVEEIKQADKPGKVSTRAAGCAQGSPAVSPHRRRHLPLTHTVTPTLHQ